MLILKEKTKIIKKALKFLKEGKVIICPTDTVYGLISDAKNNEAVKKVFKIKKRRAQKPIPIFVKDIKMAKRFAFVNKEQEKFLRKVWPGKITVVLKANPEAKKIFPKNILSSGNKIGLRIPNYKLINELLKRLNKPLTGTSANISGRPPSIKIKEVLKQFENQKAQPDLILDAENLKKSKPSTVIDLTSKKPKILRNGEIDEKYLVKLLIK